MKHNRLKQFFQDFYLALILLFLYIPIVPMTVATRADANAMSSVLFKAFMMAESWNICVYQRVVKPPQTVLDFVLLKDKTIMIRSGDTLGGIVVHYGTTVSRLCQLNGISRTTTLRIGRSLRVR